MRFFVFALLVGCSLAASLEGETRVRRNAHAAEVDCPVTLWPGGKICYTWDSSISDSADGPKMMKLVEDVFDHYMDVSCVEFYPSTASECDGIDAMDVKLVEQTAGCWAHIGCSNSQNTFINVSPECATFGVVTHELFHSLGRYHEQSRNDRDEHIQVNWDAIITKKQGNYKKCSNTPYTDTYDYQSIMHYGDMFFASGSAETMTIIESGKELYQKLMGTQAQLSPLDVVTLNTMYNCYPAGTDVKCTHGGVKKASGSCFCVEPFTGSSCEEVDPKLGTIIEVEGESFVESPNFPGNYPVNEKSFVVLQCPAGKRVSIKFLTFQVEQYGTGCGYDWVDIRPKEGEIYGAKYCGKDLQDDTLVSETNFMVFKFVTNGSWEYEGFEDEVTCV